MNGLDILEYTGPGYRPVHDFNTWRVAVTNYGEPQSLAALTEISRHLETDELFVLLSGTCTLFIGGKEDTVPSITSVPMEPLKLYNITRGTWHARALTPGSTVLMVENRDTGAHNTESRPLTKKQLLTIHAE